MVSRFTIPPTGLQATSLETGVPNRFLFRLKVGLLSWCAGPALRQATGPG